VCPQYRVVPFDSGFFGQIPEQAAGVEKVRDVRKHIERAYNLLKHREGLEPLRTRSQHGVMCQMAFANMATLLLEIVGTRKTERKEAAEQLKLDFAFGA
ncbi:MAG: transposase, partial [bacterium]